MKLPTDSDIHQYSSSNIIRLISNDGHVKDIPESWAKMSGFLSRVMDLADYNGPRTVKLAMIDKETLEVVIKYLNFKHTFLGTDGFIPEFKIEPSELVDKVLLAADFLEL